MIECEVVGEFETEGEAWKKHDECRLDSLINKRVMIIVKRDGKWYVQRYTDSSIRRDIQRVDRHTKKVIEVENILEILREVQEYILKFKSMDEDRLAEIESIMMKIEEVKSYLKFRGIELLHNE